MSKNGKPKKKRIRDKLFVSSRDLIMLAESIEIGFMEVLDGYLEKWQQMVEVPPDIKEAVILWRMMMIRHRMGDVRHTEAEKEAVKIVAQWTVDKQMVLRNQKSKKIEWGEEL